ncbi:hypothetical protein ACQ4PT_036445 [Festuca glaucescens]
MAVFELDPTSWLPWGHHIIDGGPTRLPRTYYNALQDPSSLHQAYCIAMVDPPPPPHAAAHWRYQVNNFLDDVEEEAVELPESMILNLSESSDSSVNMALEVAAPIQQNFQVFNVGLVHMFIWPSPPPEMQRHRWLDRIIPSISSVLQTTQLHLPPFMFLQKSSLHNNVKDLIVEAVVLGKRNSKGDWFMQQELLEGHMAEGFVGQEEFTTPKQRKSRKKFVPMVQLVERRFTRSCLKNEGYRPKPMLEVQPKIKKKTRAKMLLINKETTNHKGAQQEVPVEEQQEEIPVTPIHVLQSVGIALGIAPKKLTKDQLEADPIKGPEGSANDDQN